jgi:type II secretory pathway pseudopilin PulG
MLRKYTSNILLKISKYSAFSMAEMVLVLGLFSLLVVMMIPVGLGQIDRQRTNSKVDEVISDIFIQQQNAYNGKSSGEYGLYLSSGEYYLYEGVNYATADWVETRDLSGAEIQNIALDDTGVEIHFAQNELIPSTYGTFDVVSSVSSYRVTVNQEGALSISKL